MACHAKRKSCLIVILLLSAQLHFNLAHAQSRVIRVMNTRGRPVICEVNKQSGLGQPSPLGKTSPAGEITIGKKCADGEDFHFVPLVDGYESKAIGCRYLLNMVVLRTSEEIRNLRSNALLYQQKATKQTLAVSALASLELLGSAEFNDRSEADSVRTHLYTLIGDYFGVDTPVAADVRGNTVASKDLIYAVRKFQSSNKLDDTGLIESKTLSVMAEVKVWDVYSDKLEVKENF